MTARTFDDSTGTRWEVFEVHRAAEKPGPVPAGLERGWLAFEHGTEKRRLAPFPSDWVEAPVVELERLCAIARVALSPDLLHFERRREPRPERSAPESHPDRAANAEHHAEEAASVGTATDEAPADDVEHAVREFAHEARNRRRQAIEAMVELKAMLLERFPGENHRARDMRSVRRWFVEAYYFERDA